ncbi:MAG: hypothetical protein CL666_04865 [Balneola sp.]|nr:hypothetical protein [Balneola sp.]|tara:strand:- start:29134 stop:29541 length:408 start_codon:yes stop_codon:yes gene_type:complete
MSNTELLLVYGTLKKDFDNEVAQYLHRTQSFVGKGQFPGKLFKISFYPGAKYHPDSDSKVYGDVYRIIHQPKYLFQLLDEYEGIGDNRPGSAEFERREIPITIQGRSDVAYSYLFKGDHSGHPLIPSGVFSPTDS